MIHHRSSNIQVVENPKPSTSGLSPPDEGWRCNSEIRIVLLTQLSREFRSSPHHYWKTLETLQKLSLQTHKRRTGIARATARLHARISTGWKNPQKFHQHASRWHAQRENLMFARDCQNVVAKAHKQSHGTGRFISSQLVAAGKRVVRLGNSPAQLFTGQLVIGRERVDSYPRADLCHHSIFAHRC